MSRYKWWLGIQYGSSGLLILVIGVWYFLPYYHRLPQSYIEQAALEHLQREIMSFKSLNFSSSSELIVALKSYEAQLENVHRERDAAWQLVSLDFQDISKRDALIALNKKMLQTYVNDLQTYTKDGMPSTSSVIQYSYDKVVRLTIALAELEQNRMCGLPTDEYIKRIDRMHEIIRLSIVHSKQTLRTYLKEGFKEEHVKMQAERERVTQKVKHFIALNKIMYL